jgi:hypothetical protein
MAIHKITLGNKKYFFFAAKNLIVVLSSVFGADSISAIRIQLAHQVTEIPLPLLYIAMPVYIYITYSVGSTYFL